MHRFESLLLQPSNDEDNFDYGVKLHHLLTKEAEEIEANDEKPFETENCKENETAEVHGDQRVWVKPPVELFTEQIKEEILEECEFQTIVDLKDEIEEQEEEVEEDCVKIEPIESPTIEMPLPKIPIPRLTKINANRKVKKPRERMGRKPRPILPMTRPIASATTPHIEPTATPHLIVPSPHMPGIAYQVFLGDHGKNPNNQVQYTMLQSQPLFLQQTSISGTTPSSVVISQPSMVMNQTYQMTQAQVLSAKNPKIAPKMVGQSYCSSCYKLYNNLNEHSKECWANPASKTAKFRKIAPSTSL